MTVRIVPFEMCHLNTFQSASNIVGLDRICEVNLKYPTFRHLASVMYDNMCIAICGTHAVTKDCAEVFMIPSVYVKKYPKSMVWAMKTMTDILVKTKDRVQMPVLEHNRKWAETLGFQFEGIVKKYLDGKDHYMYVKVRP